MDNAKIICLTAVVCTFMLSFAVSQVDFDVICKTPDACVVEKD